MQIDFDIDNFDIDKYIKINYQPVENKSGYVWFSKRNMQIISIDVLKTSIENCIRKAENEE